MRDQTQTFEMPREIKATCPTHGPGLFVSAEELGSRFDWWVCEEWARNTPEYAHPTCRSCIFHEDVGPDGAMVRDFEVVLVGILGSDWMKSPALRALDMEWEEWTERSKRMWRAWGWDEHSVGRLVKARSRRNIG